MKHSVKMSFNCVKVEGNCKFQFTNILKVRSTFELSKTFDYSC